MFNEKNDHNHDDLTYLGSAWLIFGGETLETHDNFFRFVCVIIFLKNN